MPNPAGGLAGDALRPSAPLAAGVASALLHAFTPELFRVASATLVVGFFGVCLTPPLRHRVRSTVHRFAFHHVEEGLPWVALLQRRQRAWLTTAFTLSAHTVSVPFYGTALPISLWLGLPELCGHLVLLLALSLYVGNAIKDLACSPRPTSVPYAKAKLKFLGVGDEEAKLNANEFGLPSSHVMNTVCLLYYTLHHLTTVGLISPEASAVLYPAATLWVAWIAVSRLYLGLHTPIDLLGGALAGLALTVCFIEAVPLGEVAAAALGPSAASVAVLLACVVLLHLHPRPIVHTPSFEFTTSFAGVAFGYTTGALRTWHDFHSPGVIFPELRDVPDTPLRALRRLAVGFATVAIAKDATRAVLRPILPRAYSLVPVRVRALWQPPCHDIPSSGAHEAPSEGGEAAARESAIHEAAAIGEEEAELKTKLGTEVGIDAASPAAASPEGGATAATVPEALRGRRRRNRSTLPDPDWLGQLGGAAGGPAGVPAAAAAAALASPPLIPRDSQGRPWDVEITIRFFAYSAIGIASSEVAPRLLRKLGWW